GRSISRRSSGGNCDGTPTADRRHSSGQQRSVDLHFDRSGGTVTTQTPRSVDARVLPTQQDRAAQQSGGFRAMVVDDHPLMRESMVARLRAMGASEVVEAATVAEARPAPGADRWTWPCSTSDFPMAAVS